jgi:hypothetical protein
MRGKTRRAPVHFTAHRHISLRRTECRRALTQDKRRILETFSSALDSAIATTRKTSVPALFVAAQAHKNDWLVDPQQARQIDIRQQLLADHWQPRVSW